MDPGASRYEREVALEVSFPELLQALTYTIARAAEVLANAQGARIVNDPEAYAAWRAAESAKSGKAPDPPPGGTREYELEDFFHPAVRRYRRRIGLEQERARGGFVAEPAHLRDILSAVKAGSLNAEALAWIEPHLAFIRKQLEGN